MHKITLIVIGFLALLMMGCSGDDSQPESFRSSIKSASEIFVYEGLPHQGFEREKLEKERKRKDVIALSGFPFYTPKTKIKGDTAKEFIRLLASDASVEAWSGEKKCGGFHPDYAVSWSVSGKDYTTLICFGCREVKFVSGNQQYHYDLTSASKKKLQKMLRSFGVKRPSRKLD